MPHRLPWHRRLTTLGMAALTLLSLAFPLRAEEAEADFPPGSALSDPQAKATLPAAPRLSVTSGAKEIFSGGQYGLTYLPDGHFSLLKQAGGGYRVWWAGGIDGQSGVTIGATSRDLRDFTPLSLRGGKARPGLWPAGGIKAFDADYAGPGSVLPDPLHDDDQHLLMLYHGENHTFAGVTYDFVPFYAAIGVARSADGGQTWTRGGQILGGMVRHTNAAAPREAVGAGSPAAIVAGSYIYLFYTDWNTTYPDAIHVARAPLSGGGKPGTWRKWHQGAFSQPGLTGRSTPVIEPPAPAGKTQYAGNPSVSYNRKLGLYLMVFETNSAFYAAASRDLVHWGPARPFLDNPAGASARRHGRPWMSYASFISPGLDSDRETGASGYLYFARGRWETEDHTLHRQAVTVE